MVPVFVLGDTILIFSKLELQLCSCQPCLPCKGVGEREAPYKGPYKGKHKLQREYKEWCVCCYLEILYSFSQNCSSSSVRASRVCRVKGWGRERLYIKVHVKGKLKLQREYKEWCVCCYLEILYSFSQNCSSSSVRASRVCRVKGWGRERLYIKVHIKGKHKLQRKNEEW